MNVRSPLVSSPTRSGKNKIKKVQGEKEKIRVAEVLNLSTSRKAFIGRRALKARLRRSKII
jgi:hypothetical protein